MARIRIEKESKKDRAIKALFCAAGAVLGFTFARTRLFGRLSFLGLAFCASCPAAFYAWAVFGASLGYLSLFEGIYSIRFICCTLGCALIKGFCFRFNKKTSRLFMPSIVSLLLISTLLALIITDEKELGNVAYSILEAVCAFIFTYSFSDTFEYFSNINIKDEENYLTSLAVTAFSAYTALCSISFVSFSIPRIIGVLAILFSIYLFKSGVGAVCALAVGFSSFISTGDIEIGAIIAYCGLISSLFKRLNQTGTALAFVLCSSLLCYLNPTQASVALAAQSAAACLIFVLIARDKLLSLSKSLNKNKVAVSLIKERIYNMKNAIVSVGECVKNVSQELSIIENRDESLKENEKCTELRRALADSFFTCAEILEEISSDNCRARLKGLRRKYKFEIGLYQQTAGESNHCGDSVIYYEADDILNVTVSDGMGTGARAAVDSRMTVTLFSDLIKGGVGRSTAARFLNSALIAKSQDETLATLDNFSISPFTGQANIFKAGAAPSFILKSGESLKIELMSLPVGILRDVKAQCEDFYMRAGDRVVMLSDGAMTEDLSWFEDTIKDISTDAQQMSERIAKIARHKQGDAKRDDLTVVVVDVKRA